MVRIGPFMSGRTPRVRSTPMTHHQTPLQNLLAAIRLAEGIPRDRDNYLGLDEMLVHLRAAAKDIEAAA